MKDVDTQYDDKTKEIAIETALEKEGMFVNSIKGISMWPMLRQGVDTVLVVPVTERLKKYDVALYTSYGRYVMHRVLEAKPNYYIIRGDNCTVKEYVKDSQVIGVMKGFWRGEKYIDSSNAGYLRYAHFWVKINRLVVSKNRLRHIAVVVVNSFRRNCRRTRR